MRIIEAGREKSIPPIRGKNFGENLSSYYIARPCSRERALMAAGQAVFPGQNRQAQVSVTDKKMPQREGCGIVMLDDRDRFRRTS
jgi:hypothetical protein